MFIQGQLSVCCVFLKCLSGIRFHFTCTGAGNFSPRLASMLCRQTECFNSKLVASLLVRHTATRRVNVICIHLHLFSYHPAHLEHLVLLPANTHFSWGKYREILGQVRYAHTRCSVHVNNIRGQKRCKCKMNGPKAGAAL